MLSACQIITVCDETTCDIYDEYGGTSTVPVVDDAFMARTEALIIWKFLNVERPAPTKQEIADGAKFAGEFHSDFLKD